ncbi:hypothetical protein CRUP_017531, partial [Coryphaenoides rupestris]
MKSRLWANPIPLPLALPLVLSSLAGSQPYDTEWECLSVATACLLRDLAVALIHSLCSRRSLPPLQQVLWRLFITGLSRGPRPRMMNACGAQVPVTMNAEVSVFEVNIRFIGGLLAAYYLSGQE